jgi:uncharacterized protein (TIGR00730 family)
VIQRLCVFCGSNPGTRPEYLAAAADFGRRVAERGLGLVYGGGSVGLMGVLADSALAAGGEVIGVIPQNLWDRELGHKGLTRLQIVESMHERKAVMASLSDGFIALPGGIGTFEELFEVWTWAQLGVHRKPCGLLDVEGFYTRLLHFIDHCVDEQFIRPAHRAMLLVESDAERLLDRLLDYVPPTVEKWIGRDET